jgi:hypothetical protein
MKINEIHLKIHENHVTIDEHRRKIKEKHMKISENHMKIETICCPHRFGARYAELASAPGRHLGRRGTLLSAVAAMSKSLSPRRDHCSLGVSKMGDLYYSARCGSYLGFKIADASTELRSLNKPQTTRRH